MKALIEYLAQSLVDHPDQVQVDEYQENDGKIIYELSVAKADMGKIIGKNGRVIQSIRSVVIAAASKEKKWVKINLRQ